MSAFDLQGHRGARGLAPENTLAAFARAIELGVDTVEMDVAVTRDGAVVVHHDPALSPDIARGPDGAWIAAPGPLIRDLDLADLERYDVGRLRPGSEYAEEFPDQVAIDGERIPTLEAVVGLCARGGVRLNVELKSNPEEPETTLAPAPYADAVLAVLERTGAAGRANLQSFDWRVVARVRERAPHVATACLTVERYWRDTIRRGEPGPSPWTAGLDVDDFGGSIPRLVRAAGAGTWSPDQHEVDVDAIAEAHELGLRVVPWTVNDVAAMRRLVGMGVDGLITDYPNRLGALLRELDLRQ